MRIGIDASNIRAGGGVTHLKELLSAANPKSSRISKVIVWGSDSTLASLPERPWLVRVHDPVLEGGLPSRLWWQWHRLPSLAASSCDLLFVPGGNFKGDFRPTVVMAQNLLPFDLKERRRFGLSFTRLRLFLLHIGQTVAMRMADGVIYLSNATKSIIEESIGIIPKITAVIPHGIGEGFLCVPREQLPTTAYSKDRPLRLLYVSIIDYYKHQWNVVEAVSKLRVEGLPIVLDLVGSAYLPALKLLYKAMNRFDPDGEAVKYWGPEPYETLPERYHNADVFVFASTCETISIIIMEAMASGLPIACSNVPPMPEVLGDCGVYFNPENVEEICVALRKIVSDPILRAELAQKAYERAKQFTWKRCADKTFAFLTDVYSYTSHRD